MTTPTAASLLHLIDRAERGSLLAEEAQQLRDGIRALDAARRAAGGLQRSLLSARAERDQLRAELAGHTQQPTTTEA